MSEKYHIEITQSVYDAFENRLEDFDDEKEYVMRIWIDRDENPWKVKYGVAIFDAELFYFKFEDLMIQIHDDDLECLDDAIFEYEGAVTYYDENKNPTIRVTKILHTPTKKNYKYFGVNSDAS